MNIRINECTLISFYFIVCVYYYFQSNNLGGLTSIALISFITSPSPF